jgi:hypothetical protein
MKDIDTNEIKRLSSMIESIWGWSGLELTWERRVSTIAAIIGGLHGDMNEADVVESETTGAEIRALMEVAGIK